MKDLQVRGSAPTGRSPLDARWAVHKIAQSFRKEKLLRTTTGAGVSPTGTSVQAAVCHPELGSADPRFWGPRLVHGPKKKARTPKPGSALPLPPRFEDLERSVFSVPS